MNKLIYILPLLILGWLGYLHFSKPAEKARDTRIISMKTPDFLLKEYSVTHGKTSRIFTTKDLPHKVTMINIFASWCMACYREHKQLTTLAQEHNLPIYGIAYSDTEKGLANYFKSLENPYEKIMITPTIYNLNEWEVISTPESFLIDASGTIRYRHRGPILKQHIDEIILPIIKKISQ